MMATHKKTVWGGRVAALFVCVIAISPLAIAPVWAEPGPQQHAGLSDSLRKHVASKSTQKIDVIVHGTADQIDSLAAQHHLTIKKRMAEGAVFQATGADVEALGKDVDHLSRDVEVSSFMAITDAVIGADQVHAGLAGLPGFTGAGVGIALIDSGIWAQHRSLAGRVVAAVDFVGDSSARARQDSYGHGTHIAAIAAGDSPYPQDSTFQMPFRGVAPGANLISLRVIGADGTGMSSSVIDAIDWAIRNRRRYNIRVINLSLGHAPEESYKFDPMCEAVERAVHAGIVVVAAAGNRGKNAAGQSIYGGIDSPGNDPYAITVGALNTKGTVVRSDDELTTYSSKGPTIIDGIIKPDLVAPGNKIVSAEALGGSLIAENPTLHVAGSDTDAYMTMSGTSMAAGVVSGAAALVLEANSKLTPRQVKTALQYSATFMPGAGLLGAGAGTLNVVAAVESALNGPSLKSSAIGGELVTPSGRITVTRSDVKSSDHIRRDEILCGDGILWGDRIIWTDEILGGNRIIWTDEILGGV
jgi:serine protease AprX